MTVRVTSELPVGAGLGSSAAYCVALSAALLAYSGEIDLPQETGAGKKVWLDVNEKKVDLVNRWAFEGERILHGRPSGIDNTVSSFGKISSTKIFSMTMYEQTKISLFNAAFEIDMNN